MMKFNTYEDVMAYTNKLRGAALRKEHFENPLEGLLCGIDQIKEFALASINLKHKQEYGIHVNNSNNVCSPTVRLAMFNKLTTRRILHCLNSISNIEYDTRSKLTIAGGSLSSIVKNIMTTMRVDNPTITREYFDIDLFTNTHETFKDICENDGLKRCLSSIVRRDALISDSFNKLSTTRREMSITLDTQNNHNSGLNVPVQLILARYDSLSSLLHAFDIPASAIALHRGVIYMTHEAVLELMSDTIVVDPTRASANYESRLAKYCHNKHFNLYLPKCLPNDELSSLCNKKNIIDENDYGSVKLFKMIGNIQQKKILLGYGHTSPFNGRNNHLVQAYIAGAAMYDGNNGSNNNDMHMKKNLTPISSFMRLKSETKMIFDGVRVSNKYEYSDINYIKSLMTAKIKIMYMGMCHNKCIDSAFLLDNYASDDERNKYTYFTDSLDFISTSERSINIKNLLEEIKSRYIDAERQRINDDLKEYVINSNINENLMVFCERSGINIEFDGYKTLPDIYETLKKSNKLIVDMQNNVIDKVKDKTDFLCNSSIDEISSELPYCIMNIIQSYMGIIEVNAE